VSDPSVEWVEGGSIWSRAYAVLQIGTLLAVTSFFALYLLYLLYLAGDIPSLPLPVTSTLWLSLALLPIAIAVFISALLPITRPVALRVGISREGLAFRYPLRTFRVPWSEAVWLSPTIVSSRKRTMARFLLTPHQSERVYAWWYRPSSRPV
jgi:hypothetical protein